KAGVSGVCFSPDGKRLAGVNWVQDTVKVWEAATGREQFTLKIDANPHGAVWFSPDGKLLAGGNRVWGARTGRERPPPKGDRFAGGRGICFSPDGKRVAGESTPPDTTIKVWDAATGEEKLSFKAFRPFGLSCLCYSPDGRRLAGAAEGDVTVNVWD